MFDQGFVFSCFKWILTAGSIVGVVLNIRGDRNGFLIWIFTNTAWVIIDLAMGIPEQAALFAVYSGLAVWGYIKWGGTQKDRGQDGSRSFQAKQLQKA